VTAIADTLNVPTDFLLEQPPFDCWEDINQNRAGFLHYTGIPADTLRIIWGIDLSDPDSTSTVEFISFISTAIASARPTEEGDWEIELRPGYKTEKAPADNSEREIGFDDFSFAMHRHSGDLTEKDKEILLSMANQLAEANKRKTNGETD
jgi:hypothetical protein